MASFLLSCSLALLSLLAAQRPGLASRANLEGIARTILANQPLHRSVVKESTFINLRMAPCRWNTCPGLMKQTATIYYLPREETFQSRGSEAAVTAKQRQKKQPNHLPRGRGSRMLIHRFMQKATATTSLQQSNEIRPRERGRGGRSSLGASDSPRRSAALGCEYCYSEIENLFYQDVYDQDILIIAAAGNAAYDVCGYPASYETVMSVASVAEGDGEDSETYGDLSWFSTFNDQVEIAAPGR